LTKVQARFRLDNSLDEQLLERIRDAQAIYGIERVKVENPMTTLTVEYDATRLRPAEVEAALRRSGIAVTRI
jgi:copper chaperone CopZ